MHRLRRWCLKVEHKITSILISCSFVSFPPSISMTGFTCGYCKLQTANTLEESWELMSNHSCLNNRNLVIDENNIVYVDEDNENNSPAEYNQSEEESHQNIEIKSSAEWPNEAVLLLIEQYEKNKTVLDKKNTMKKHIWTKISNEMQMHQHRYSWDQVQNKWKSLIRTYKSIKDHNSATGRNRKSWSFFDKIDSLLRKDPAIDPPTVVHNGIMESNRATTDEVAASEVDTPSTSQSDTPSTSRSGTPAPGRPISRKRKLAGDTISEMLQQNEKHHQDEMKEKRRFNDLLEILINNLKK